MCWRYRKGWRSGQTDWVTCICVGDNESGGDLETYIWEALSKGMESWVDK